MTLSDDNILNHHKGTVASSTSVAVSLTGGTGSGTTTAGSSVVVFGTFGASVTGVPSGFVSGTNGVYYKHNMAAGESSWTFTTLSAANSSWVVVEMTGLDLDSPPDVVSAGSGTTMSSGDTKTTPTGGMIGLTSVVFAAFSTSTGTTVKSWGSYTNDFVEVDQITGDASNSRAVAVAVKYVDGGTVMSHSATATLTIASGTASASGRIIIFHAADSQINAPLGGLTGYEFGTHGGLAETTVSSAGSNQILGAGTTVPTGTWGTHYLIQSGSARNGGYGLRIATSAATAWVPMAWAQTNSSYGFNVRVATGSSGTPTVATWDVTTGTDLLLVYDVATTKFGLRWGAGTVSYQTGTTPLDTWAWVDVRIKIQATTHQAEWYIETGTGDGLQTSPADLTGMTSTTLTKVVFGSLSSQTITMDADDPVFSAYWSAFPLGPHDVRLLKVDTGGTATVSGTSANFNVFTANGTLAAFNSANALAALDEVPPTVSASADGLVQVTTAASDYVELPMQNLTLAADEIIAGVRMVACMWGGTGSGTGTFGIKGWDGVTETELAPYSGPGTWNTLLYDAASPTAISSAAPLWMAYPWGLTPGSPWTSTRLNNAVLRVGYSSDATPDMGISAIYLEVAIKSASTVRTLQVGDDEMTADIVVNPYNSATVSYVINNNLDPGGATARFTYSVSGTPQTPVDVTPGNSTVVDIHADAFGDISDITLGPV